MLRNNLKVAFRNLLKRKAYSLINIAGLAIGMSSVIIIFLFIQDELSFDKFHDDAEDIYRIIWNSEDPQTRTPHPMAQALVRDFAAVESAVTLSPLWGPGLTRETFTVSNPQKEDDIWFEERGILGVDSTFFDVFSFDLINGNDKTILRSFGGLVISETMAAKYFGDTDPIGKYLAINDDTTLLVVEGVFADVPRNSHFHFDALVPYVTLKALEDPESVYYEWDDFGHFNYIKMVPDSDPDELEAKLLDWVAGYTDAGPDLVEDLKQRGVGFVLQPITDIHLRSSVRWELEANGQIGHIYIMGAAALFILIIAAFNFMNLSAARSMDRAKEVGIRKSLGAVSRSLSVQFLGESIIISVLAMILAGLLVEIALPSFNILAGKELSLGIADPVVLPVLLFSALILGVLAGLYPAVLLSSFGPVAVLKGKFSGSEKGRTMRKTLVILQFTISMFLIAGAMVIFDQLSFLENKPLGYNQDQVVVIPVKLEETGRRLEPLQTEITRLEGVTSMSAASNLPGGSFNQNPIYSEADPGHRVDVQQFMVDYEVFEVLDLELVEGRRFSRENPADVWQTFVLNETAVKALNLGAFPVGQELILDLEHRLLKGTVIGVVRDFNFQSLHQPIRPLLIQLVPAYNWALLRVSMADLDQTMADVETIWNNFDGNFDFEWDFLNQSLGQYYSKEKYMGIVFGIFSALAILIACMGLGGIAAINFAFKKKEVGIRKVLGAPSVSLITDLLKEYTIMVFVAIVLSFPFWWFIMNNWLANFSYRVNLDPLKFALAGVLLILISWSTLSYLTYNTIKANTIDSLKEE